MLRVAGRRLSSLPWRSSQSQTTSAFVSRNAAFVSDDGRDSAASSRPILSPYQFSFPPDLIRGHLFLSSDLGLASFFFFFLFLIPRALYMYSISGFRGFLYWKNEYRLPQTTFFSCVLRCVLDCLMSHFFATRFRVSCLLQLVNWMKNLSWIFHEFLYFCFIFYSDFFRILSTIICSNLQYFEVLSFTFVFCTNPLLLLYSIKHILKVQAELNSLSSRLEGGVCFHVLCLLLLLYL